MTTTTRPISPPHSRLSLWTVSALTLFTVGLAFSSSSGCNEKSSEQAQGVAVKAAEAPTPVTVEAASTDFVFRYIDPATGRAASASTVSEIPETAREQVVVYQDSAPPPAGWDHVADLRKLPATTTPTQDFRLKTVRQTTNAQTSSKSNKEVVMFVRDGCGFCTKADRWLTAKKIPFDKLNLDHSPKASRRLSELAKRAGITRSSLRGVPVIFVGDEAIVGFDKARLARLLGV